MSLWTSNKKQIQNTQPSRRLDQARSTSLISAPFSLFSRLCDNPAQFCIRFSNSCFNSCLNNCFLFENRARGACPRGPPDLLLTTCLRLARCRFFGSVFDLVFSPINALFYKNDSQHWAKMWSVGAYFSENFRKRKSVFGLRRRVRIAYEPILQSAQGDPKNEEKRESISEVFFWGAKHEHMWKNDPKTSPKRWVYFGGERLGGLSGHL